MSERLSVHICTRDRPTELHGCLVSLYGQTFKDWDLIILDDASEIPLQNNYYLNYIFQRISSDGHGLKILRNDSSDGVAKARNICIESDTWNELIVRVDDDSVMDSNYLQRLYDIAVGNKKFTYVNKNGQNITIKPEDIGGVGGLVPDLVNQNNIRNSNLITIFNKVGYDSNGIVGFADDGGYRYEPFDLKLSHHLRSSFLFKKSQAKKVGGFPDHLGRISFTEETWYCLKILYEGKVLITDTGAICWHLRAQSGGCRAPDYQVQAKNAMEKFSFYFNRRFLKEGLPFVHEAYK